MRRQLKRILLDTVEQVCITEEESKHKNKGEGSRYSEYEWSLSS